MISHRDPLKSEFFEKSQMSESIDVPSGCNSGSTHTKNDLLVCFGKILTKKDEGLYCSTNCPLSVRYHGINAAGGSGAGQ